MNVKNFVLSYYKNATSSMHIQIVRNSLEAQSPHTHDYFQIYYVTKGSVAHFTENGSSILLRGDMFIIPPKCMHYINQSKDSEFYSFSFTAESISRLNADNKLALDFISMLNTTKSIRAKVVLNEEEVARVENILSQTYLEFNEKGVAYEDVMRCYLTVLLTLFARKYLDGSFTTHIKASYVSREQIKHCIDYVEQNYSEDLSIKEMAQYSALSKSVFCKAFKDISGYTFNQFLNKCRVKKSTILIERGLKITAIYSLVGYKDFSTFYRNFKKFIGCSPEEYLKDANKSQLE